MPKRGFRVQAFLGGRHVRFHRTAGRAGRRGCPHGGRTPDRPAQSRASLQALSQQILTLVRRPENDDGSVHALHRSERAVPCRAARSLRQPDAAPRDRPRLLPALCFAQRFSQEAKYFERPARVVSDLRGSALSPSSTPSPIAKECAPNRLRGSTPASPGATSKTPFGIANPSTIWQARNWSVFSVHDLQPVSFFGSCVHSWRTLSACRVETLSTLLSTWALVSIRVSTRHAECARHSLQIRAG